METVSSHNLLEFHSSEELTGGFFTTCGELESGENQRSPVRNVLFCVVITLNKHQEQQEKVKGCD